MTDAYPNETIPNGPPLRNLTKKSEKQLDTRCSPPSQLRPL